VIDKSLALSSDLKALKDSLFLPPNRNQIQQTLHNDSTSIQVTCKIDYCFEHPPASTNRSIGLASDSPTLYSATMAGLKKTSLRCHARRH
jgi:hypothetical protein